ncbi:MAG: lysylphosphatidylglycerol synthase domain-containing protein, partial [Acidobacteriota bacterium]
RYSFAAFPLSLLLFVFQSFSFWFIMQAYGLHLSFWIGAAVFLIVHFGTALPNAPANIGTYQLFCVLGLTLFGVEKTTAAGFSIVVFVLLTIPLWALGFIALGQSGMTLASVKDKVRELRRRA